MRAAFALRRFALASSVVVAFAFPRLVAAQANGGTQQQGRALPNAKADPDAKRALQIADYARWRSIQAPAISSDGQWVAWSYTQVRRDDQLHVKQIDSDREFVVEGGSRPTFSDDAQWVAYYVAPLAAPAGRGGRGGRGGGAPAATPAPAGRGGPDGGAPTTRRVEVMNLATGDKTGWDDAANFEFSKGSALLVIHRARPQPVPRYEGADLIVRDLKAGTDRLIGSVTEFAFNKSGALLAYTVDAADDVGNGLYLTDVGAGVDRVLENARERYSRLTWSDDGSALAALHGKDADTLAQRENTIVAVTGLAPGGTNHARIQIAPRSSGVPEKFAISEKGTLVWSDKNDRLFFGIKSQDPKRRPTTEDTLVAPSDVDIFHANDDRIQSVQRSQAATERNRTDRAVLDVAARKVTRVSDSTFRNVQLTRDGKWAVAGDDRKYIADYAQARADYYRINVETGERTPIVTGLLRGLGLSPDSRYFLYWKDKQVWSYDLAANKHVNISAKAPVSFVNAEDDHVGEKPPYGVTGIHEGREVRASRSSVRHLGRVARRKHGAEESSPKAWVRKPRCALRYVSLDPDGPPAGFAGGGGGGRGGRGGGTGDMIDIAKPMLFYGVRRPDEEVRVLRVGGRQSSRNRLSGQTIWARAEGDERRSISVHAGRLVRVPGSPGLDAIFPELRKS